jgi:hypothetical protein
MSRDQDEDRWEKGWNGHHRAQLVRLARLSLAQKIDWLEEAHEVVQHLARTKRNGARDTPTEGDR